VIGLQQLPDSIGKLAALNSLDLSLCSGLQRLPGSVTQLAALSALDLSGLRSLQARVLPDLLAAFGEGVVIAA
jgi:Leucine-rich repeat (LRR) protein